MLVAWTCVRPSWISFSAGDTRRWDFRSNADIPSTMSVMSPMSRSMITGKINCWFGCMTVFCVVFDSINLFSNFPFIGWTWKVMSRNLTMVMPRFRVTEYFLKNDLPMRTLLIKGSTMKVPSNTLPPMKKRRKACFCTGTMLSLAICTSKSGAGSSSRRAAAWAVSIRRN